jgi:DNA-binding cell septation regulator SpoVG
MADRIRVTDIRFTPASAALKATGLRGWAICRLDGRWELDGLAVRRTAEGRYVVTLPARRDGAGIERPYLRPIDEETREEIERAVLEHARRGGWIS